MKHAIATGNLRTDRSFVRRRRYPKKTCFEMAEIYLSHVNTFLGLIDTSGIYVTCL